jgi:hypothetical protein
MKLAIGMKQVKTPVKLLAGLAAGAMLVTATTLTYQGLTQDEVGSPIFSRETAQAPQALVYLGPDDPEVAEQP